METFLRSPIFAYRHMSRIYVCARQFNTRIGRGSSGLGSTRDSQDYDYNSKLKQFSEDKKMQRMWDNTFKRIASLQSKHNPQQFASISSNYNSGQQQQYHNDGGGSGVGGTPLGRLSGSGSPNYEGVGGGNNMGSASIGGKSNTVPPYMFSLQDQQLMKLSFAEGYFYGQTNQKKSKFRWMFIVTYLLVTTYITATVYTAITSDSPLKRAVFGKGSYRVRKDTNITFSDVKGCDESKQDLADIVEFLKNPIKFTRLGGKLPKGVLLVGPPGTGKTLLARAVAGEANVPFFHASGSEFDEMLVGQGAKRVRDLFEQAKQQTPCVIFIDEIDSVGGKRSNSALHPYANQTINQLLSEMDGFNQNAGIIVMGATNRPNHLDPAILRPGRFDIQVTVPKPDYRGRKELFEYYLEKVLVSKDIDIDKLCKSTIGFTGADIENLVNQAAFRAATEDLDIVTMESLEFARDKIIMGPERRNRVPNAEENLMVAYHEGGHALVAYYTEKANQLHKVTIVSRNESLGHTSTLPKEETHLQTKERIEAAIDVTLGGRVAEELIYGSAGITSGCSSDLKSATQWATTMVKDFGMSEKVGLRVVREDNEPGRYVLSKSSDATSEIVESEINRILDESHERVRNLLTQRKNELKLLAEALTKYETLDAAEVKSVLEGKDPRILRPEKDTETKYRPNLRVTNPLDILE